MTAGESELRSTFRAKADFMKTWKPASTPSNRDRLELYALHKMAVSGDAPSSLSSATNAAERAKYQAWRSKSGISQEDAMKLYLQEADRQLRVYGTASMSGISSATSSRTGSTPQTPQTTPNTTTRNNTNNTNGGGGGGGGGDNTASATTTAAHTPRGLAAIPLLCAATAESRPAYLRRLSQTPLEAAWWQRQESLCGNPGTLSALPETLLLMVARLVEHLSLTTPGTLVASFFWPLHNTFLGLWMMIILYITTMKSMLAIVAILVWGTRRTGISLSREWEDTVPLVGQSISAMVERHQALTSRLIGLIMLPLSTMLNFFKTTIPNMTMSSSLFVLAMSLTWWYWFCISPILTCCMLWTALASGACFALIEFAGV
jgi:acyl-CoA-binding protein